MPEYEIIIHSEKITCEEYYEKKGNDWVNVLVGDIQRMKLFYEKGWKRINKKRKMRCHRVQNR